MRLTGDERAILTHVSMWGSDGYPVQRSGRGWTWGPWRGIRGSPVVYKTKKAAVAAFEAYYDTLIERAGAEAREKALALRRSGHPAYQNRGRSTRRNGTLSDKEYLRRQALKKLRALPLGRERLVAMREALLAGDITPRDVVGTGYKDGRKVALAWLDDMIAKGMRSNRGRSARRNSGTAITWGEPKLWSTVYLSGTTGNGRGHYAIERSEVGPNDAVFFVFQGRTVPGRQVQHGAYSDALLGTARTPEAAKAIAQRHASAVWGTRSNQDRR